VNLSASSTVSQIKQPISLMAAAVMCHCLFFVIQRFSATGWGRVAGKELGVLVTAAEHEPG
ncbi:unnamed protein product, partial [Coccothraustes coccothraustes]